MKSMFLLIPAALLAFQLSAQAFTGDDYFMHGNIFAQQGTALAKEGNASASAQAYDKAIDAYLQAAATDPAKYGIKSNLSVAIVLGQKKDYEKAAKVLELIIEKHPEYPELWLVYKILGKVRADQKQPAAAADAFEAFLSKVPAEKLKPKEKEEITKQIALLRQQAGGQTGTP